MKDLMFVTQSLQVIVARPAQKIDESDGIRIRTLHPAFISEKPDRTGFDFNPLHYVKDEFTISLGGMIGYGPIPDIWAKAYDDYVTSRS